MDILNTIKSRRSIREFKQKEIPGEIVEKLKEALIWAPSAGNLQSRKFYFVFDKETKEQLTQAALGQDQISQAPLAVVVCADQKKSESKYKERGRDLYCIIDASLSIQNMMLVATEEGLGTCWAGALDEDMLRKILNLSESLKPIGIIPVGYADESPEPPKRISIEEAVEEIK